MSVHLPRFHALVALKLLSRTTCTGCCGNSSANSHDIGETFNVVWNLLGHLQRQILILYVL